MGTHAIKIRFADSKAWWFLASGGRVTRLRVHATLFTEDTAEKVAQEQREHAAKYGVEGVKVVAFR